MSSISLDFRPVGNGFADYFETYHSYFNYTDDNGFHSTLGAFPSDTTLLGYNSDLVAQQNNFIDLGYATGGAPYTFTIASGSDADALWTALNRNAEAYNTHPENYDPTAGALGYNSNGFSSGDLIASGYGAQEAAIAAAINRNQVSPMNPSNFAPGFDKPVPTTDFVAEQTFSEPHTAEQTGGSHFDQNADVTQLGGGTTGTFVVNSNGNLVRGYAFDRDSGTWVQNSGPPGPPYNWPGYVPPFTP